MPTVVARIVEVVVFRFRNDRPEFLVLKRAPEEHVYPGIWQVLTGTIRSEESALAAAQRELIEETGLSATAFWVVPYTASFYVPHTDELQCSLFFAAQVGGTDDPTLSHEHCAWEWLSLEGVLERLVWPGQKDGLRAAHDSIVLGAPVAQLNRLSP